MCLMCSDIVQPRPRQPSSPSTLLPVLRLPMLQGPGELGQLPTGEPSGPGHCGTRNLSSEMPKA